MKFNPTVFERLLFPLNKRVYRQIQESVDTIEEKHPGKLPQILENFEVASRTDTQTKVWRPGMAEKATYPSLDITILFNSVTVPRISSLHKSTDYKITADYEEKPPSGYKESHLVVGFYREKILNSFIVPLEYLLGFNEKAVLKDGSYQLYSHTILSPDDQSIINKKMEAIRDESNLNTLSSLQQYHQENSLVYIGITKRTWQERYRQHCGDMGRGSNLLFHRALRGEFCFIEVLEHIVERAGLTENQALEIEEREVEKRSLHSIFPKGLNMIPGGYAGLKCVHEYAKRTGYSMKKPLSADTLEGILVEVQRHTLTRHFKTSDIKRINAEIARLWAENIEFRINVISNHRNLFSHRQIQAARIWHACGWPKEKILKNFQKLDPKEITMDQVERLLEGKTYTSIPDVLI